MCGIAGIISRKRIYNDELKSMTNAIKHRGPDGEGIWINDTYNVGLGHRRLSILDLSTAGSQPMHYLDRYTITFNGEIYNYIEIKDLLIQKGYKFKSDTDTEVLIANFDYKREKCLDDFDGMFAFAIWDKKEQTLFCARDRFGEKPFYYHQSEDYFYFCSEMKGLWSIGIPKLVNNRMLFNYVYFDYLYNPNNLSETFFKNIYQLEPSTYLTINKHGQIIKKTKYWDIDPTQQDENINLKQAKEKFTELFYTSIKRRLRADVAIGSSLSGGLDSSSIVCAIDNIKKEESIQKTFSAIFPGFIKDESKYINLVLNNIKAESHYCYPNSESFEKNIKEIIYHQEEPFNSLSIAAQYEVMELAKKHDTIILLDGQGADEYLCGYHGLIDSFFFELKQLNIAEYQKQMELYKKIHKSNNINGLARRLRNKFIKNYLSNENIDYFLGLKAKLRSYKESEDLRELYENYKQEQFSKKYSANNLNEILYYVTFNGNLQELLRYADRNSMAHSREIRLPFIYHELVSFIFKLPSIFKVNNGFSKYLLRYSMDEILPSEIAWRKDKIGYEPPISINLSPSLLKSKIINEINL